MMILIIGSKGQLGNEICKILREGVSEKRELPLSYEGSTVVGVDVDKLDP